MESKSKDRESDSSICDEILKGFDMVGQLSDDPRQIHMTRYSTPIFRTHILIIRVYVYIRVCILEK